MSATWKALRMVESMGSVSAAQDGEAPGHPRSGRF
jgi:hypothetical protein